MAQRARDFIGSGHSIESCAGEFGVSRVTIYTWKEKYPEFGEAVEEGENLRRKLLESALLKLGLTGQGNASALIFLSKNWAGMRDDFKFDHTTNGKSLPQPILAYVQPNHSDEANHGDAKTHPSNPRGNVGK
jgi:hypothetical protein